MKNESLPCKAVNKQYLKKKRIEDEQEQTNFDYFF